MLQSLKNDFDLIIKNSNMSEDKKDYYSHVFIEIYNSVIDCAEKEMASYHLKRAFEYFVFAQKITANV